MKKYLDYIIENDLYDIVLYSSDGDDITPEHMNIIKQGYYTLLHNSLVHSDRLGHTGLLSNDDVYRVFHIRPYPWHLQTASRGLVIEVWVDADVYLRTIRDIKINQLLC